ncbi:amidohydrolase family protein [Bradyrhizobium sp. BR 1432]|uniref:amidohydrolase family protein n=1 Tax=Bradyrhizobium sp. BR 1432 TaxID=3447966 RepID=UPI003EE4B871
MSVRLPALSCNSHCHVFGPAELFPFDPQSPPPLAEAPKQALFALNDACGLERCVVVQSKVHGYDNRAAEDAIAARPRTYRGVALVATDVSDDELKRLDRAGFRGARFNYMHHLGTGEDVEAVLTLARRLAPLGWHVQVHGDPATVLGEIVPRLLGGPAPVVIDHIGRIDAALGLEQPHFTALRRLMEHPACWVKVSGIDRITRKGPPYDDAVPFARLLASEFTDRVVWGNDWPHPNHQGPLPSDEELVDRIANVAPDSMVRRSLMVTNPARLYHFGETE